MISENDKQAILNGAYGITRSGRKGKPEFILPEEWGRLNKQAEAMSAYAFILQERVTAANNSAKAQTA